METKDKELLNAACMLGKQRVSDCNPQEHCAKCGWNRDEHERRMALPLEQNEDGLRHKNIAKPEATAEWIIFNCVRCDAEIKVPGNGTARRFCLECAAKNRREGQLIARDQQNRILP